MGVKAKLLADLPFNQRELDVLLETAPKRYKRHFIEKRNGRGKREIAQPTAEVKLLQAWVSSNFLKSMSIHEAATAYREGKRIKDHAMPHLKTNFLLKLDFVDFFNSIKAQDFTKYLSNQYKELSPEDIRLLANILFMRVPGSRVLRLSIGAPTSPMISNIVMYDFDSKLTEKCAAIGVKYTRYADDIALSTNQPNVLSEVFVFIQNFCKIQRSPKLKINENKTVFTSRKHLRKLTGIILTPERKLSIGRERKRLIRATFHRMSTGEYSPAEFLKLRGLLAFAASVEPAFLDSLCRMNSEFYGLITKRS